jgi:hypothetical protein
MHYENIFHGELNETNNNIVDNGDFFINLVKVKGISLRTKSK